MDIRFILYIKREICFKINTTKKITVLIKKNPNKSFIQLDSKV